MVEGVDGEGREKFAVVSKKGLAWPCLACFAVILSFQPWMEWRVQGGWVGGVWWIFMGAWVS